MPRNADNPFNVMKEYLIKTFDKKEYAERFLKDGEMLFRNVSYFRKIEDDRVRGDINEGFSKERLDLFKQSTPKGLLQHGGFQHLKIEQN